MKNIGQWKQVVGKKGSHYFMLIEDYISNASKVLGIHDINKYWSLIPGYDILVGSFILEMKIRKIVDYPDVLKDANMTLLSNECLLPVFMKILL